MAIGMFSHFLEDEGTTCVGIEAGGLGLETDKHGCSLEKRNARSFTWTMFISSSR